MSLLSSISKFLGHEPTIDQNRAIAMLANFCLGQKAFDTMILCGYAGTGKTTLVSALVKALIEVGGSVVLLAPTGRAAKVFSGFAGKQALTIHKKIYDWPVDMEGGPVLSENKHKNTLFIVDEASMLSGVQLDVPGQHLFPLGDLLNYVASGTDCKLLLCGDTAQLPPVSHDESPAISVAFMRERLGFEPHFIELQNVVRHDSGSAILNNATALRECINIEGKAFRFYFDQTKQLEAITGNELEEALQDAYHRYGDEQTLVICPTNKRANLFNQQIRNRVFGREEEICAGDLLMIVKNDYLWSKGNKEIPFLANGDRMKLQRYRRLRQEHGFKFADAQFILPDYSDADLEATILLDTIATEAPSLSRDDYMRLRESVWQSLADEQNPSRRRQKMHLNHEMNALQVKFGYALTCHKAQGGQWPCIFIDQGYLPADRINTAFYRWLYTALTRATEKVYLVNFNEIFF
jgi:exodeoxyribonuclease V